LSPRRLQLACEGHVDYLLAEPLFGRRTALTLPAMSPRVERVTNAFPHAHVTFDGG
jgi:hypothetical protein